MCNHMEMHSVLPCINSLSIHRLFLNDTCLIWYCNYVWLWKMCILLCVTAGLFSVIAMSWGNDTHWVLLTGSVPFWLHSLNDWQISQDLSRPCFVDHWSSQSYILHQENEVCFMPLSFSSLQYFLWTFSTFHWYSYYHNEKNSVFEYTLKWYI